MSDPFQHPDQRDDEIARLREREAQLLQVRDEWGNLHGEALARAEAAEARVAELEKDKVAVSMEAGLVNEDWQRAEARVAELTKERDWWKEEARSWGSEAGEVAS